ncbi:MAG: CD225/dispanin family protein [Muribaculaceae bacterium]|nr:CD225/dispanin family protein [Muribaculaceae bacterium]
MGTNDKIYWIIVNGQPRGPFTPDEIAALGVASPTLRVWRKGLPEWMPLPQLPELAGRLGVTEEPATLADEETDATVNDPASATAAAPEQPRQQTLWQQPQAAATASWGASSASHGPQPVYEPMPPTYLPWNVLVTICCCIPVGIAGVIFSSQVSRKYERGDIEGARQASERAAWCFIIAFTLGLVLWPFQMLLSLL